MKNRGATLLVVVGVAGVLAARGIWTLASGSYESTTPLGTHVVLAGAPAIAIAIAYLGMGCSVASAGLASLPRFRRPGIVACCVSAVAALAGFVTSIALG